MDIKNTLEALAVVSTVLQYLSGVLICRKFWQKHSTGDSSAFPFLCGVLASLFWVRYGIYTGEQSLVLVNSIGAVLFSLYSCVFYYVTTQRKLFMRQSLLLLLSFLFVIWLTNSMEDEGDAMRVMGLICVGVSICFFAAPFTSLTHVLRTKSSESLPFPLIVMSFFVCLLWLIYGIIIRDTFVQLPNCAGCLLSLLQLLLFVCYPPKKYAGQGYKLVSSPIVDF